MNIRKPRSPGFSIIELMIVIAIIVILIGMLVPSLGLSKAAARATECGAHLHNLHIAYSTHVTDPDDKSAQIGAFGWQLTLGQHMEDDTGGQMFKCPEHEREIPFANSYQVGDLVLQVFSGANYLYDMELAANQWTLLINNQSSAATLAIPNPDLDPAWAAALPNNVYYLYFEDIRPGGGDQDFHDVVLKIEELTNGQVEITYVEDAAGYTFNLATKSGEIIWENMDAGGSSQPGSTGGDFEVAAGSYGINSRVDEFEKKLTSRILLLDYQQSIANIASTVPDDWDQWLDGQGVHTFARHPGNTVNVVMKNGGVKRMTIPEIDPDIAGNIEQLWEP